MGAIEVEDVQQLHLVAQLENGARDRAGKEHREEEGDERRGSSVVGDLSLIERKMVRNLLHFGEQTVDGRVDRDRIRVGRGMGRFSRLTGVVLDSDLEMSDMEIGLRRGEVVRPALAHYFREGTRTRMIDLPDGVRGSERTIEYIGFTYRNLPGGGRARVQVWAQ